MISTYLYLYISVMKTGIQKGAYTPRGRKKSIFSTYLKYNVLRMFL